MIDFTNCPVNRFRAYGGANGNKINITYQGHSYMLKFPPKPSRNRDMSYSNGCISEYVACHIFEMLGFRTQETLLGNYTDSRGKTKLVVACRDFTEDGKRLIEFAHLKNTCIDSEQNGYGKELSSILEAIEEQSIYPSDELRQFFWDSLLRMRSLETSTGITATGVSSWMRRSSRQSWRRSMTAVPACTRSLIWNG